MAAKSEKTTKNILSILLVIITLGLSFLAYTQEGSYFFETILGSMLFAAPVGFYVLLVAIRINWENAMAGLFKFAMFAIMPIAVYGYISLSTPETDIPKEGIRIASYNLLHYSDKKMEERLDTLLKVDADILSLLEVNDLWRNVFNQYQDLYPYQYQIENTRATGFSGLTVLLSKYPIVDTVEYDDGFLVQHLVQIGQNTTFNVTQVHPFAPLGRFATKKRNQSLSLLEDVVPAAEGNAFVLGDFNTVNWHNPLKSVAQNLKLNLLTEGMLTWPSYIPATAIDHIYASSDVQKSKSGKVCMPGADHCLVYTDIILYIKDDNNADS